MTRNQKIRLPFWGVDGCPGGWFCAGLARTNGEYGDFFVAHDIEEAHEGIATRGGKIALIDIPIGAPDGTITRTCDESARTFIGPSRSSSVFPVLCREAIVAYREKDDDEESAKARAEAKCKALTGKSLPRPGWNIVPKIVEMDVFMQSGKSGMWREAHPEVCFRALNNKSEHLAYYKKDEAGESERFKICLPYFGIENTNLFFEDARRRKDTNPDDILDALVLAITARIGSAHGYKTLPENPPMDSTGLPMEMVYAIPPLRG